MSQSTTNYGFTKPELTDVPDITVLSQNWEMIDSILKSIDMRNKITIVADSTDANSYATRGIYFLNNASNVPSEGKSGLLFVETWSDSLATLQFWVERTTHEIYLRVKDYSWSAWSQISTHEYFEEFSTELQTNVQSTLSAFSGRIQDNYDYIDTVATALREQIGNTLVTDTISSSLDTSKSYVYVGTSTSTIDKGDWIYYDGTEWKSGGVYNSEGYQTDKTLTVSDMAADAKVVGDNIADLKSAINNQPVTKTYTLTKGRYISSSQTIGQPPVLDASAGKHCIIDLSDLKIGSSYAIVIDAITANATVACMLVDVNGNVRSKYVTLSSNGGFMTLNPETGKYEHKIERVINTYSKCCFSIYNGSNTLEYTYKHPDSYIPEKVFVSASGNDSNSGLSTGLAFQTLDRAIKSGAKNISILSDLNDNASISRDVNICGNGHTVYGDTVLTTETYNEILRAPYTADVRITNCFIDKTTPLTETVSGSGWKGPKYNIACYADDQNLLPVEDVSTCEATDNSFTWVDGYFYIHATGSRFSYVIKNNILSITDGNVKITDLLLKHSYSNIVSASNCNLEINGCKAIGSVNMNCVSVEDGNLIARDVETAYSWNDGLNTHGRGDSIIINCYCHDCSDDGISQHDMTTGVIIGGEFCRCGKGGISSPINSAKVDIYNVYVHDNTGSQSYGIYASNSSGTTKTFRVFNSVIENNRIGLKIVGHKMLSYGNKLSGNTTDTSTESGGEVTEL